MANRFILNETSYFGSGSREVLASEVLDRGAKKVFVVTDRDLVKFGVAEKVLAVLKNAEIEYEFDDYYYDAAFDEYEKAEAILEYNRNRIKNMSHREFEFFVADIFEKLGFSVKITKATRDGGKDIIATKSDPIPYTLIVECKHWGEDHKVDVSVVRSVYGVQVATQANQSVIVTSSKFTKDAREFAEDRKNLMALWDIDDLLKLIC